MNTEQVALIVLVMTCCSLMSLGYYYAKRKYYKRNTERERADSISRILISSEIDYS